MLKFDMAHRIANSGARIGPRRFAGHSLCRDARLRTALPFGMVEQDHRSGRAPAGHVGSLGLSLNSLPTQLAPLEIEADAPGPQSCKRQVPIHARQKLCR
jgi:hypothetical protein